MGAEGQTRSRFRRPSDLWSSPTSQAVPLVPQTCPGGPMLCLGIRKQQLKAVPSFPFLLYLTMVPPQTYVQRSARSSASSRQASAFKNSHYCASSALTRKQEGSRPESCISVLVKGIQYNDSVARSPPYEPGDPAL